MNLLKLRLVNGIIKVQEKSLKPVKNRAPDPRADKKIEYADAVDRIEVERAFSLAKRSFGLGLITTKLECTTRSSIVLSIIAMNVDKLTKLSFMRFLLSIFQGTNVGLSLEPTC